MKIPFVRQFFKYKSICTTSIIPLDPHPPLPDTLLDAWLPSYQFQERHGMVVHASPKRILDLITPAHFQVNADPLIGAMLTLREWPMRFWARFNARSPWRTRAQFGLPDFTLLARQGDDAIVLGLAGRFWRFDFGLQPQATPADFLALTTPGVAKLVLSFEVLPHAAGGYYLQTQTRVYCNNRRTYLLFLPYWLAIRLGSGLIRKRILTLIKRKAEAAL